MQNDKFSYMGTLTAVHDARRFQFFTEEEDPASNEEIVKLLTIIFPFRRLLFQINELLHR